MVDSHPLTRGYFHCTWRDDARQSPGRANQCTYAAACPPRYPACCIRPRLTGVKRPPADPAHSLEQATSLSIIPPLPSCRPIRPECRTTAVSWITAWPISRNIFTSARRGFPVMAAVKTGPSGRKLIRTISFQGGTPNLEAVYARAPSILPAKFHSLTDAAFCPSGTEWLYCTQNIQLQLASSPFHY